MNETSLELQSRKIDEYRTLENSYEKELAGLRVTVTPNVYPGGTDSELLCESMVIHKGDKVLDLCTGNGVVALKAASAGASEVVATDLNPVAVNNALLNVKKYGFLNIRIEETNLFPVTGQFGVITINPPYTDNQAPDTTAICFWDKDNKVVKGFFAGLSSYQRPGGRAYITWSSFASNDLLPELANKSGYRLKLVNSRSGSSGFEYFVYEIIAV